MKPAILPVVLLAVAVPLSAPAAPKPKPVVGKYNCKGPATLKIDSGVAGLGPMSETVQVKAKMRVVKGGAFDLNVLTKGWYAHIEGNFPAVYQPAPIVNLGSNRYAKELTHGCLISRMFQNANATQNRNGRNVTLTIEQEYACRGSSILYTDTYRMTCKK